VGSPLVTIRVCVFPEREEILIGRLMDKATKLFTAERISRDTLKKWSDSHSPGDVSSLL